MSRGLAAYSAIGSTGTAFLSQAWPFQRAAIGLGLFVPTSPAPNTQASDRVNAAANSSSARPGSANARHWPLCHCSATLFDCPGLKPRNVHEYDRETAATASPSVAAYGR